MTKCGGNKHGFNVSDCTIIIVNWNTKDLVCERIREIIAAESDYPIIVVDNHSEDGSQQAMGEFSSHINLIANPTNRGFAPAVNQALAISKTPFALLLNTDASFNQSATQALIEAIKTHASIGACACRTVDENNREVPPYGRFPSLGMIVKNRFLSYPASSKTFVVDWLMGAYLMLNMHAIRQIHGLDEQFVFCGEDIDLGKRLKLAGYSCLYLGSETITHSGSASTHSTPNIDAAHFVGMIKFYEKHNGKLQSLTYRLLMFVVFGTLALVRKFIRPDNHLFCLYFARMKAACFPDYQKFLEIKPFDL